MGLVFGWPLLPLSVIAANAGEVITITDTIKMATMSIANMRFTIFHLLPLLALPFLNNKTGHQVVRPLVAAYKH